MEEDEEDKREEKKEEMGVIWRASCNWKRRRRRWRRRWMKIDMGKYVEIK